MLRDNVARQSIMKTVVRGRLLILLANDLQCPDLTRDIVSVFFG